MEGREGREKIDKNKNRKKSRKRKRERQEGKIEAGRAEEGWKDGGKGWREGGRTRP